MIFQDRHQAGQLLAAEIAKLNLDPQRTIICSIPRGGVVVGDSIAAKLKLPLTVLVIKKLGAPGNPELAIGATASHTEPVLDNWLIRDLNVPSQYLQKEIRQRKKEIAAREKFLGIMGPQKEFKDKHVVVVDDGIATGQTVKAAARILRSLEAKNLILAVPCASPQVLDSVKSSFNQVICLEKSQDFWAVGQFYQDFRPIEDNQVKEILAQRSTKIDNKSNL